VEIKDPNPFVILNEVKNLKPSPCSALLAALSAGLGGLMVFMVATGLAAHVQPGLYRGIRDSSLRSE
jgi:hypothetical protein